MSGISDIEILLASMEPRLSPVEVVFCSFPDVGIEEKLFLVPIGFFVEAEGISLIVQRSIAERNGISFSTVLRAIALDVHSSLEAVGLTAAVASRLALHGISANVVAAYYHDHVFVPAPDAERALQVLQALQAEASGKISAA
jgi:hypothetical protein